MITHVVQWRVKDEAEGMQREEILSKMQEMLEGLNGKIPEIITLSAGINERPGEFASDMVLLSTFSSWEDLKTYAAHPEHQKVVAFVGKVAAERRVVDFES